MASARYLRWARPGDDAGPGWNCLRGSIGLARHLRSVRNDHTAAGLRVVRPQPHPRSGTGLGSGSCHPRCCSSVVGWRSSSRRDARRHDGDRFGDGMHSGRHRAPGLCDRASLQADTVRLYERNCIDRIDQPAAKALRLLDRGRRTFAEPVGDRRCDPRRKDQLGRLRDRARHVDGHPAAQGQQTAARHPDCGGRGDRRRRCT